MLFEVAPVAPPIAIGVAALGSLIAFCVCWGLLHSWNRTFGALFEKIGGVHLHVRGLNLGHPLGFLLNLNQQVRRYLGAAVVATENAFVYLCHMLVGSVIALGHEVGALAETVEKALYGLVVGTIPHKVKALTAWQWAQIRRIPALLKRLNHLHAYIEARVRHAVAVAVGAGAHAIAHAGAVAGHLGELAWERTARQGKRLTRLEKALAGAGLLALGIRLLAKLKLGWLRCPRVGKAGNAVCKMPYDLLESLIADTALLAGAFSIVAFAKELQALEPTIEDAVKAVVREL